MNFYAVIDTNVLVSAMMKENSVPRKILDLAFGGKIIPLLNDGIDFFINDMKNHGMLIDEKIFKQVSLSVQQKNSAACELYRKLNFEVFDVRGEEFLMLKTFGGLNFA